MNAYAHHVVGYLLAQSWQIALLAGIVGLISFALRNRSAHLRYLLWLIVLAKCLVPPFLTVPLAVLPERSSSSSVAGVALPEEYSAPEIPISVGGATQPQELKPAVPSLRELVALVWGAGAFLFLLWVGGRAARYTSWLRARRRPLPPALQESIRELSEGFKFRKGPRIWLLEDINQPFVWGLLRGSVYLPADFVGRGGCLKSSTGILPVKDHAGQGQDGPATHGQDAHATTNRQRSVLAHELSHIARFDAGVNLLQVLAQAVYWFHPFVWWSNRKMRQEREKCCDEMVIVHLNTPPEHYTWAIVDALATERRSPHPIPSLAIVGSVRDIEERIKTMLKPGKKFHKRPSFVAATIALLIALVTIPTALVLTARGQGQPANQTAGQAGANSEKPEQPRFAARTFNSKMRFNVCYRTFPRWSWGGIGQTPSATPLEIPTCWVWWVQPQDAVVDWDLLVREIRENKVPGLKLDRATDSDVKRLADLTGLRHLDLIGTEITDAGLVHLKGMTGLESLALPATKITDAGLEHLKDLTKLRQLQLDGAAITDAGLDHLKDLTGLQLLDLGSTQITDAGLEHLKGLIGLQLLNLGSTKVTDAGLERLKGLTELLSLDLTNTAVTGAGLAHLKGLTRLQELRLVNTRITDAGLEHLKGLTGLQYLRLSATQITDAGLEHLKDLTHLQGLGLSAPRVTDVGLRHLKGLTGLQRLNLNLTQTTNAGLESLGNLTEMQWLHLSVTQITDAGLACLESLTKLEDLSLSNTRITDAGLVHLKGLEGLRRLNLTGTQVTEAGVQQLKQSLPKATIERGQLPL